MRLGQEDKKFSIEFTSTGLLLNISKIKTDISIIPVAGMGIPSRFSLEWGRDGVSRVVSRGVSGEYSYTVCIDVCGRLIRIAVRLKPLRDIVPVNLITPLLTIKKTGIRILKGKEGLCHGCLSVTYRGIELFRIVNAPAYNENLLNGKMTVWYGNNVFIGKRICISNRFLSGQLESSIALIVGSPPSGFCGAKTHIVDHCASLSSAGLVDNLLATYSIYPSPLLRKAVKIWAVSVLRESLKESFLTPHKLYLLAEAIKIFKGLDDHLAHILASRFSTVNPLFKTVVEIAVSGRSKNMDVAYDWFEEQARESPFKALSLIPLLIPLLYTERGEEYSVRLAKLLNPVSIEIYEAPVNPDILHYIILAVQRGVKTDAVEWLRNGWNRLSGLQKARVSGASVLLQPSPRVIPYSDKAAVYLLDAHIHERLFLVIPLQPLLRMKFWFSKSCKACLSFDRENSKEVTAGNKREVDIEIPSTLSYEPFLVKVKVYAV